MFNNLINDYLIQKGATLVGLADLSVLPKEVNLGYKYGISIGIALDAQIVSNIPTGPHMAYYNEYCRVSNKLNQLTKDVATLIHQKGYDAHPQSRENVHQDKDFRTVLPYKTLATLSGLGWIGKSALLINKTYGGAVRYYSVLTNMPFVVGKPITKSRCGDCNVCTSNCPAHAVNMNNWTVGMDRDELLNAHKCKQTVIERGKVFSLTHGTCGICIAVCPYTQDYIRRSIHYKS